MIKEEFAEIVNGITASRIAELTGKAVTSIQSYLSGRAAIPYEIAVFAYKLEKALKGVKIEQETNDREMKKIIHGKLYDTQTATLIDGYDNGSYGDFNALSEELYRTKTGRYFLAGSGGAMTKYARCCGENSRGAGEDIIPLEEYEAKDWLEKHSTPEKYVALFGAPPEA